jgi:hypothetical protein
VFSRSQQPRYPCTIARIVTESRDRPADRFRSSGLAAGLAEGLRMLPPSAKASWTVDIAPVGISIAVDAAGRPAMGVVCIDKLVGTVDVRTRAPSDLQAAAEWIATLVVDLESDTGEAPRRLRVRHTELVAPLERASGKPVAVTPLPSVDSALVQVRSALGAPPVVHLPWCSGSWAAWGPVQTEIEPLFESAGRYWKAAPWRARSDAEPVTIDIGGTRWYCVVLGQSGVTFGLGVYSRASDLSEASGAPEAALASIEGIVLTLSFDRKRDVPEAIADEVRRHRWQLPARNVYPSLLATNIPAGVLTAEHMSILRSALDAVASGEMTPWPD